MKILMFIIRRKVLLNHSACFMDYKLHFQIFRFHINPSRVKISLQYVQGLRERERERERDRSVNTVCVNNGCLFQEPQGTETNILSKIGQYNTSDIGLEMF